MTSTLPAPKQLVQSEDTTEGKFRRAVWDNYFETLYPFQKEVTTRAGDTNSIVVIPTGSGKTVIAAALAARKLATAPASKIIFVVNRVPLVTQQAEVLRTVQGTCVACVCGERKDCTSWDEFCRSFNVLVIIDAVFVEWGMMNPTMWQHVGLLILDEVHHARGNSNYMKILTVFHREKKYYFQQVLGLSASPVLVSTPSEVPSALKALENQSRCQIVTVTTKLDDLKETIPSPASYHLQYSPSPFEIRTTKRLNDLFTALEAVVREVLPQVYKGAGVEGGAATGVPYPAERFISALKQERGTFLLSTDLNVVFSSVGSFPLAHITAQILQCINTALILIDDGATAAAMRVIESVSNNMQSYIEKHCSAGVDVGGVGNQPKVQSLTMDGGGGLLPMQQQPSLYHYDPTRHKSYTHLQVTIGAVFDKFQQLGVLNQRDGCITSSKMAALLGLLERHIGGVGSSDEDSFRCIVFCRTKATVQKVTHELGKLSFARRVSPQYFVGHNATLLEDGSRIKMTDKEQQQRLAEFRCGTTKLLIATSVAEEGLDIPICNMVVRFDSDFTALSYLQSRGRARKVGSSFYTITRAGEGEGHISRITNCISTIYNEVQYMQDCRDDGQTFY